MAEKERILVADDEESIREMVSYIVIQLGHDILMAKDGKEVFDLLKKGPCTLLVIDIELPGLAGPEWMKSLRTEFPDMVVLCLTSKGGSYPSADGIVSETADYIVKPFTFDEMRTKLTRTIHEKNLIRDLTKKSMEFERMNEELKRGEQLKSDFILGISHELRTPLTVIKEVFSLVLEERIETSPPVGSRRRPDQALRQGRLLIQAGSIR